MNLPQTPSFYLTGKRALITGASSGIGRACAVALADYGAAVTLAARRVDKLEETAAQLRDAGQTAEVLALDVGDIEATARHSKATDTMPEDFDAVMTVNLRGAYFLSQAVAKGLIAAGRPGSLINISSQMGHVGGMERAVYCASKVAVEGFTKAMAIEFGPHNIRINTICPTFILTELTQPTFDDPDKRAWVLDKIKLGRAGDVKDIMGAAVYLASDAAALVTGTAVMIDGGWTAD
jgi:NAD(P)-dependent dehydrogenase (short-subunit alcohol dehydrogenase family)